MAEILDEEEQKAIEDYLDGDDGEDPIGAGMFWIGLTSLSDQKSWRWLTSGTKATYFNWFKGEPNNVNGNEHLVQIYPRYVGRTWNDISYEAKSFALCQQF